MRPATHRRAAAAHRLLVADPSRRTLEDAPGGALASYLRAGDLLVVNDAATLPASLYGTLDGARVELRLTSGAELPLAWGVLFGEGDWRARTEDRPAPPWAGAGARLAFSGLDAVVLERSHASPRLLLVRLEARCADLVSALYGAGQPIQYSYADAPLRVWDVQTSYAARPWAVELPSAALPFGWELLGTLRRRGVEVVALTHAAGLSSTGAPELDALLPLPERFEVPEATARAVAAAVREGRRVVAVGTSVVRALETAARQPDWERGAAGLSSLRIDGAFVPRVVSGLVTGMHEPGTSHYDLLQAFTPAEFLCAIDAHAEAAGYLGHEFGDHTLLLGA